MSCRDGKCWEYQGMGGKKDGEGRIVVGEMGRKLPWHWVDRGTLICSAAPGFSLAERENGSIRQ